MFSEVGKRRCWGEKDRMTFSHLNQLISGHSKLNNHQSKINKEISNFCDICNIPEDLNHYLFVCKKFDEERIQLQEKVEEILYLGKLQIILATLISKCLQAWLRT